MLCSPSFLDFSISRYHDHLYHTGYSCTELVHETGGTTTYNRGNRSRTEGKMSSGVCTQVSTIQNTIGKISKLKIRLPQSLVESQ